MRGHACASRRATRIRIRNRLGMEEKWLSLGRIGAISTLSRDVRDADDVLAAECFAERFLPRATSSTLSFSRAEVARERHPNELHANFCLIFQSFPYSAGKFPFNVNWYASIPDCQSGRPKVIQLYVQAFENFSFYYVRQLSKVPSFNVVDSFSYNFRLGRDTLLRFDKIWRVRYNNDRRILFYEDCQRADLRRNDSHPDTNRKQKKSTYIHVSPKERICD